MKLILIAGALALIFSLFGTPALIKALARRGYGQFIRDDGPSSHHTKRGTPTMGGIIIIFAALAAYLLAHLVMQSSISVSAVLIFGLVIALGLVGFLDDYIKVSRQNSAGISARQKILGQVFFASPLTYDLAELATVWSKYSRTTIFSIVITFRVNENHFLLSTCLLNHQSHLT